MQTEETQLAKMELIEHTKERAEKNKYKMEDLIRKYCSNKEIARERAEENKLVLEEIEDMFNEMQGLELIVQLPDGEYAKVNKRFFAKEVLDKDSLLAEMQEGIETKITKDDIKTPYDFCALTKQNKLTPEMIKKHTALDKSEKIRVSRMKKLPKKYKNQKA